VKTTIKQVLQTLNTHFVASIFSNPRQFKAALADVPIETDGKRIRNLLNIAMCEMKAYSRLESSLSNNTFVVDNLSAELSSDFMIDVSAAKMVIESIAELLGYKPVVVPKITNPVLQPVVQPPNPVPPPVAAPRVYNNDAGIFTDPRDGQKYRTVKIGNQIWMAENLNYKTGNCWAYRNIVNYRQEYGLLYDWETAMNASPAGWHLPTRQEWDDLISAVGGEDIAGTKLKSKTGWNGYNGNSDNGTGEYGVSALLGGYRSYGDGSFLNAGSYGYWWSATEYNSGSAYYRNMYYYDDYVIEFNDYKDYGFSVRCLRD
jgi:uncharacterized protein (TIGR02145 family)